MDNASKILILGGLLNLAYGLLTGIPAGLIRQKEANYSKYLRFVHVGALMWGPILLSMTLVIPLSTLDPAIEMLAAVLLVLASLLLDAKDTINWRLGVKDEFAEKKAQLPLILGGLSSLASIIAVAIFLFGAGVGALA